MEIPTVEMKRRKVIYETGRNINIEIVCFKRGYLIRVLYPLWRFISLTSTTCNQFRKFECQNSPDMTPIYIAVT